MVFVAKLRDDFKYSIQNEINNNVIHSYRGETYYTFNEINNMFLNKEERNDKYIYYMSIKIELFENKITVYANEISIIVADDNNIVGIMPLNKFSNSEGYIQKFVDQMKGIIISFIDYKSKEGRTVLLKNFLNKDNIPAWVQENVYSVSYEFKKHVGSSKSAYINIKNVIGTDHSDYYNKTWLEVFYSLKRGDNIVKSLFMPEYYDRLQKKDNNIDLISFIKMDDEYYIGQGNHRTCMAKFKGLDYIYAPLTEYKTDFEYKEYFEKFQQIGLKVDILNNEDYENIKFKYNLYNEWEAFNVIYEGDVFLLCGLDTIKKFYKQIVTIMKFENRTFFQRIRKRYKISMLKKDLLSIERNLM
jgi:hypothetical protein